MRDTGTPWFYELAEEAGIILPDKWNNVAHHTPIVIRNQILAWELQQTQMNLMLNTLQI
mgnify:CR=1 FL=1